MEKLLSTTDISVLLPSRGRTTLLKRSLCSLIDTAARPENLQVLLAFDRDDVSSSQWFVQNVVPELVQAKVKYTAMVFDPMGYARLHEYLNQLASLAHGQWLFFWNDDAVMHSQGWDSTIMQHQNQFKILRIPTHNCHPYAIFPIVPKQWFDIVGCLSNHQLTDAWISQIGYMLDIIQNVDISVLHDRYDLTGCNKDQTYLSRVMFEGNPDNPLDFNHANNRLQRMQHALKICEFLESNGTDMSWFRNVQAGQQDPWAKMVSEEYDPNHQVRRYN